MASLPTQTLLSLQFLGLLIASIFIGDISDGFVAARTQREFDYFALALQWPGTFCQKTRHCCSSNACCRGLDIVFEPVLQAFTGLEQRWYKPLQALDDEVVRTRRGDKYGYRGLYHSVSNAPTEFTIHGLWPDYNDGTWPACCTRSSFDIKKIATLHDALEKYWPSLSCGSSSTCHGGKGLFWAHEWEKHGTCSFPAIRDEYEYFSTTLNLYFKYNVTKVLNDAGYVPSNSYNYPLGGVISAIQNAFQATPLLVCSNGAVEELRLCFYKDFKPRDCVIGSIIPDGMLSSKSSCPKYVSLPAFTSLGLENGGEEFPWLPQIEAL